MSYDKKVYFSVLDKLIGYIAYQPRSECEVKKKLGEVCAGLGLSTEDVCLLSEEVLNELKEDGYINDVRYIENYIRSQTDSGKKSLIRIKLFLTRKGLDRKLIDSMCESVGREYEAATAVDLGKKKLTSLSGQPREVQKRKLASYLAGKGFGSHVVFNAVDTVLGVK